MLRTDYLAFSHDTGRQVRDAHGRVGLVDVLAAGARGAVGVDAQVRRVDLHRLRLVGLGQCGDRARAGVDAPLRFRRGHALHAMTTRLELELPVDAVTDQPDHHVLVAAHFARTLADELGAPALALRIAGVHAQQVAREQGRFVPAGPGSNFQKGVA